MCTNSVFGIAKCVVFIDVSSFQGIPSWGSALCIGMCVCVTHVCVYEQKCDMRTYVRAESYRTLVQHLSSMYIHVHAE